MRRTNVLKDALFVESATMKTGSRSAWPIAP